MPAPPRHKAAKHFTTSLDPSLAETLFNFCQVEECTPAEATRTILRQFFSSEPESGAIQAARQRAYNEVRVWMLTQANRWFKEMHTLLMADLSARPQPRKQEENGGNP